MSDNHTINIDDLFKEFGRYHNVATFLFKMNSPAFNKYGPYVVGSIRYSPKDRIKLQSTLETGNLSGLPQIVKLDFVYPTTDREIKVLLRREGFLCEDIENYHYVQWNSVDNFSNKVQRKLPNVITIKVDTSQFPPGAEDNIILHRYISSMNAGWEFIDEEKYEFIGIEAGLNDGTFPEEYIKKLDLNIDKIKTEDRMYMYYYQTIGKKRSLTHEEKNHFMRIKDEKIIDRIQVFSDEIKKAFGDIKKANIEHDKLKMILDAIFAFKESRVLFIPAPIYWDFRSYAHIFLRHVKEYQLGGNFENKTVFLYKYEDIKDLMRRVLEIKSEEIKKHYSVNPRVKFSRHGSMAIEFNGDYYTVDISESGRIESFYRSA